jgi:hypothetical protein
LTSQVKRVLKEDEELTREIDVLQLYLQNVAGRDERPPCLAPGLTAAFFPSHVSVARSPHDPTIDN